MFFVRWIPTFLAFPLSGLVAMLIVGPNRSVVTALAVGATVGGIVGAAQWLALGRLVDWRWMVGTLLAVAAGSTLSLLTAGSPVTPVAALVTGVVTGLILGVVQGLVLRRTIGASLRTVLVWAATVGIAWAAAWTITSLVIIDLDRGHAVFGSSGALVATIVTGVVLRLILGDRVRHTPRAVPDAPEAEAITTEAKRGA